MGEGESVVAQNVQFQHCVCDEREGCTEEEGVYMVTQKAQFSALRLR